MTYVIPLGVEVVVCHNGDVHPLGEKVLKGLDAITVAIAIAIGIAVMVIVIVIIAVIQRLFGFYQPMDHGESIDYCLLCIRVGFVVGRSNRRRIIRRRRYIDRCYNNLLSYRISIYQQ